LRAKEDKAVEAQEASLTLVEVLDIAAAGYPDEFLRVYYHAETGEFNDEGCGDTLAESIVREIRETFDPGLTKTQQLQEVTRVLCKAIEDIESILKSVEASGQASTAREHTSDSDDHHLADWENEGGQCAAAKSQP
jgi:hypothetical protein